MVNSASQALAEFKSQKMGGLLSGFSSNVSAPTISGTSLSDSASDRLARSAPKKSSTAFMDQVRQSGKRMHSNAMAGFQQQAAQRQAQAQQGGGGGGSAQTGYQLPSGKSGARQGGGSRGQYGLTVGAASAFNKLSQAYNRAGQGNLGITSGGRTREQQAYLYNGYKKGLPGFNLAAPPGTSLHESGIAADFGGPIQSSNTRQHAWLRQNAAQFKWYWVGQRFGEPWHWEYHPEWR